MSPLRDREKNRNIAKSVFERECFFVGSGANIRDYQNRNVLRDH